MKAKSQYVLGKVYSLKYREIAHDKGAIIWFLLKGNIRTQVSKGTINDFHYRILKDADNIWRGRATRWKKGIVTVSMPLKVYAGDDLCIPGSLVRAMKRKFKPIMILVDTKKGLRILEE